MRASHSKAKCLRLKLVARPLLTRELIFCIFLVTLALFLLHGRDLKCICNHSSASFSAELSRRRGSLPRRRRGGDPASPSLPRFGGSTPACIHAGRPLSWGARVPLHQHFSPWPHSAPFPPFPMVAFGDLPRPRSNNSCRRGSLAGT